MKLKTLLENVRGVNIKNAHGMLKANWKTDLAAEEDENYLPPGYNYDKVLELSYVEAKELGKGHGDALMKQFLNTPEARSAELIFLDPNPGLGLFRDLGMSETQQISKLSRFYSKYGFKSRLSGGRMWLVQKGKILRSQLPT